MAVLAGSSIAVAAADDKKPREPAPKTEQTAPKTEQPRDKSQGAAADHIQDLGKLTARVLQMADRNNAVAFLDKLVASGRITQGDANKILRDWDDQHPNWQPPIIQLKARILEMGNRNNVVALLDKMLAGAKITQGEYNQILNDWDKAHPNWQPPVDPLTTIMDIKDRNRVVAILDKAVAASRITHGDANKILKEWDDAHPGWILDIAQLTERVMKMQNHDNVVALLDKMVAGDRLNQGDANKILKDWEDAHANQPPATTTTKLRKA